MQKILVTGSKGQLGSELKLLSDNYKAWQFLFTDVGELDVTDKEAVQGFCLKNAVDIIVNCASYTAVDRAEEEEEIAMKVNASAVENLAQTAAENAMFLVHISTDYVFDGKNSIPYKEEETPGPISAYSRSKYAGELAFLKHAEKGILLRTSWLYSAFGLNFVKTMLRLGRERKELKVVNDQIGTPTYAGDLAEAIMSMLIQKQKISSTEIYHYSNQGVASWYDFAYHIMRSEKLDCKIHAVPTTEYPLPAKRPYYSLMDKSKVKRDFGLDIRHWTAALDECLTNIRNSKQSKV